MAIAESRDTSVIESVEHVTRIGRTNALDALDHRRVAALCDRHG